MDIEHIEKLKEIEDRSKSNCKRLDEHDEQLKTLSNVYIALTKMEGKVTNVENDVIEMKTDLKEIKEKPLKEYEETKKQIRNYVLIFILGIAFSFIAFKLGLGQYL